ncbi:MAG: hypothetical protein IJY92_00955 [Alphaproteobacteria bacterium]|nr:hypothetical protein [Alphaproteobacteria bacterium]
MKRQTKKQEQGAIIIEIIAVIALLGVMGPLLFRQISNRNEEVENINIATEVRIIKEALSSYILSHHAEIAATARQNRETLSTDVGVGQLSDFLPTGYEDIATGYRMSVLLDENKAGGDRLQGYIVPDLEALGLPEMNIRRVARISNLIGADGGIYINGDQFIHGTGGAWQLESAELAANLPADEHTFVATTGMDTFVPTVNFEDFDPSNINLPNDLALGRLHAWNYFSVGQIQNGIGSCFTLNHHNPATGTTGNPDVIFEAGQNDCSPLFWVGSSTDGTISGDAVVKQKLHLRSSPNNTSSIILSSGHDKVDSTPEERNQARSIKVFDVTGKEIISIDATGSISVVGSTVLNTADRLTGTGDNEKLTIKNGRIDSNVLAPATKEDIRLFENPTIGDITYSLDPRYTSVMNDIRLESRGGARLSDLLPTYSLKEIKTISSPGTAGTTETIYVPACPKLHYPAIMVTPVSWHQNSEQEIIDTVKGNLTAQADGTLKQSTIVNPNAAHPVQPRVTITYSDAVDNDYVQELPRSGGTWHVSLTYVRNEQLVNTPIPTQIKAIVHTYCVFDTASRVNADRPDSEK